jgi:hypothetical protein
MTRLLSLLRDWIGRNFPSDEQLELAALPKTLADFNARREQLEVCREVAIRRSAELQNTTTSPIHRKAS